MNIVLTIGRSAPIKSESVYLDFKRHEISRMREYAVLWPKAFLVAAAILVSPYRLKTGDLVDFVYGDCKDGGPLYAKHCIMHHIWHARRKLEPLGIGFKAVDWSGYDPVDLWV